MKILQKIGATLATATLLVVAATTSAFAADLTIEGNGASSNNKITVANNCSTSVSQTNKTLVVTAVSSSANTGDNQANYNTTNGGDVTIDTGAAESTVAVGVEGGSNTASDLPNCCECQSVASAAIIGNGANSHNRIRETNTQTNSVRQKNKTTVRTYVKSKANSGRNRASHNTTNDGNVGVTTDDATSSVGVSVTAPSNTLNP